MDGQAQAPDTGSINELAELFSDTPDEESQQQEESATAEDSPDQDNESEAEPQSEAEEETEDESQDETEEEAEEKPTTEEFEVTIKGEDGADTKLKVSKDELIKGYYRQADYTRKTQALAERENQAVELLSRKHDEIRTTYLQNAEVARTAIIQMAGFRSDAEMAQLAATDPATWVAENQRQTQIRQMLGNLSNQMKAERESAMTQAQQLQAEANHRAIQKSWAELEKLKIDKPKLVGIYQKTSKEYGFTDTELAGINDHRLVKMMADAAAYRELKAKAPQVTQKAKEAPRLPNKQTPTQKIDPKIEARMKSGRAKLTDLAAFF